MILGHNKDLLQVSGEQAKRTVYKKIIGLIRSSGLQVPNYLSSLLPHIAKKTRELSSSTAPAMITY